MSKLVADGYNEIIVSFCLLLGLGSELRAVLTYASKRANDVIKDKQ